MRSTSPRPPRPIAGRGRPHGTDQAFAEGNGRESLVAIGGWIGGFQARGDGFERRTGRIGGQIRTQSGDGAVVIPIAIPILGRGGRGEPDFRLFRILKTGGQNPDDLVRLVIDVDGLAERRGGAAETSLGERQAYHSRLLRFGILEGAPKGRRHAEDGKKPE